MESINKLITIINCVLRYQHPVGSGPFPVFLLLHGWTGDENSIWIFAPQLPRDALLIAPRGFYQSSGSGYSWNPKQSPKWPDISDFFPAVELLFSMLSDHSFPEAKFAELHLIGFSQGAALAYSIVAFYPERVASIAGLSGFLPEGASETYLLENILVCRCLLPMEARSHDSRSVSSLIGLGWLWTGSGK